MLLWVLFAVLFEVLVTVRADFCEIDGCCALRGCSGVQSSAGFWLSRVYAGVMYLKVAIAQPELRECASCSTFVLTRCDLGETASTRASSLAAKAAKFARDHSESASTGTIATKGWKRISVVFFNRPGRFPQRVAGMLKSRNPQFSDIDRADNPMR